MAHNIIDGFKDEPHILAREFRDANMGAFGTGDYVLEVGGKLQPTVVSNNRIDLADGVSVAQGARCVVEANTTEQLIIENGIQGKYRNDIIVKEYKKDAVTKIETFEFKVIKGVATTTAAVDPTLTTGAIRNGSLIHQMALYRVKINGINITAVEQLYTLLPCMANVSSKVDTKQNSLYGGNITSGNFNTLLTPGTYFVSVTNLPGQPIAQPGTLVVSAYSTVTGVVVQTFITYTTNPRIFQRLVGTNWVELSTSVSTGGVQMRMDSLVKSVAGVSWITLYSLAQVRALFGVSTEKGETDFTCVATNGDNVAFGGAMLGTTWSCGNLVVLMDRNFSGNVRVNHTIFMR